jgi:serine/threonine protein phosphatase PrpC
MKNNHANFRVQAHALTDKGRRPNNEDFVTSFEPTDPQERQKSGCIYIVADGVGGASVGERASQYAAEKVLYEYLQHPEIEPGKRLKQVISRVNREIYKYAKDKGIRMATTMTAVVVLDSSFIAANVGDSRSYLIHRNEVSQITQDHNIVGEMVRDGQVTEAEALKNKAKNRLTRSIGGEDEVHVDIFGPIPLQAGDKIVLCSDGLTRYALKEDIANLTTSGSPEQITQNLVAFAKDRGRGGADNISVITVAYEPFADLEATIQQPRPAVPEQPWEILETVSPVETRRNNRQLFRWLVPTIILIGFIGAGSLFALTFRNQIAQLFSNISPTPSITSTIGTTAAASIPSEILPPQTPTSSPTFTSTVDLTMTSNTPIPTQATLPAPALLKIPGTASCRDGVKIRLNPSASGESPQIIPVNSGIDILGRTRNDNEEAKDWYRIEYSSPTVNYGWVWADCVRVDPALVSQIPLLDIAGNPIVSNAPPPSPTQ